MNRAHANAKEKNRLRQFKQPNQQQAAVMRWLGVSPLFLRQYQFVTAARFVCHIQPSVDGEPMELSTPRPEHLVFTASTISPPVYIRITAATQSPSSAKIPAHRTNTSNPVSLSGRRCL